MATTTVIDIGAFGIAVACISLAALKGTAREDARSLVWRRASRVAVLYGLSIGILAGALAFASWGFAGYISAMLDQTNQNAVATPGLALLYMWLGVGVVHAPLAGFTVFRSTRQFGPGVISGVLAGALFAVGTGVGVILLITGLPSMEASPGGTLVEAALFSGLLVVSWVLPSAGLAALGCLAAMVVYRSRAWP